MQPREQVDTGVDVGIHETAPARTSADPWRPGRLRVRSLAARAAAGLLVAVAGLLALPLQAQAQTISIGAETDGTGDAEGVEGDTIELTVKLRTLTEITLLCAERPKAQKTGSAWMHLATLYRSLS